MLFIHVLLPILPVALIIIVGFIAAKIKLIANSASHYFASFVIKISFPALLFNDLSNTNITKLIKPGYEIIIFLSLLIPFLLLFIVFRNIKKEKNNVSAMRAFICSFPNMVGMGAPIMLTWFDKTGILPIIIGNIIVNIFMLPIVVYFLEAQDSIHHTKNRLKYFIKHLIKTFTQPLIIAVILGIIFSAYSISLPKRIDQAVNLLGKATIGVSLFALGLLLSKQRFSINREVIFNITIKNLLQPFLALLLVMWINLPTEIKYQCVLLVAMPSATITSMFAARYNIYVKQSINSLVCSTLLSLLTLPLFFYLLQRMNS